MSELAQAAPAGSEAKLEGLRRSSKGIRVLAGLLCGSTLGLIALGALVTGFGVGMAVPDWPTTYGQNMFTFPWLDASVPWSVKLEHGHRLAGSWVGLLTLAMAVWLWIGDSRSFVRKLGLIALFAVIVQGVLGGMRVVKIDPRWAVVHGPLAQAFFALSIALLYFVRQPDAVSRARSARFAWITVGVVYLQIVTGAGLRHLGLGLSLHLFFAFAVLVHLGLLVKKSLSQESKLASWTLAAAGMGAAQLFLGLLSWVTVHAGSSEGPVRDSALGAIISTTHVVMGAALLGTLVWIALKSQLETRGNASPEVAA